jgi:hypothetical protein
VPVPGARGTSGWVVLVALAGVLLVLVGTFHLAQGLGALLTDEPFLLRDAEPVGGIGVTAWAWLHVALGVVVVGAGVMVFGGRRWARAVGVVVSLLSAAAALTVLSDHPGWGFAVLALDALVVLALTVHGSEIRAG